MVKNKIVHTIKIPNFLRLFNYLNKNRESYYCECSMELKITYAHISTIGRKFEKMGFIKRKKDGRKMIVKLTKKGEKLADLSSHMLKLFGER